MNIDENVKLMLSFIRLFILLMRKFGGNSGKQIKF